MFMVTLSDIILFLSCISCHNLIDMHRDHVKLIFVFPGCWCHLAFGTTAGEIVIFLPLVGGHSFAGFSEIPSEGVLLGGVGRPGDRGGRGFVVDFVIGVVDFVIGGRLDYPSFRSELISVWLCGHDFSLFHNYFSFRKHFAEVILAREDSSLIYIYEFYFRLLYYWRQISIHHTCIRHTSIRHKSIRHAFLTHHF